MKTTVSAVALVLCAAIAGCARVEEAAMSIADKVNAAHPVMPEVRIAQEKLKSLLAGSEADLDTLQAQVRARMKLRALGCTQNVEVGRFASLAAVKGLPIDRACLREADNKLLAFYAVRSIGALLARPPLRPSQRVGPLASLPRGNLRHIVYGVFARDAGVAVLKDTVGAGAVVEIPGGRPIATLPPLLGHGDSDRLSPNGQVYAISTHGQGTVFYEAETGHRLWDATEVSGVVGWLPELRSFVLQQRRDQMTVIADGLTAALNPHPVSFKGNYSAALGGDPGRPRLLMGSARELQLFEHERAPEGIRATLLKEYRIPGGGITSGRPVPMNDGKLVAFASTRDIGWLRLDDGSSGKWITAPKFSIPFAKLDEIHLLLLGREVDTPMSAQNAWSFDVVAGTVAKVQEDGYLGLLINPGERLGYMRRGENAYFGDAVNTGEAVALDKVVAAFTLEAQVARLQAMAPAETSAVPTHGGATGGFGTSMRAPATVTVPGLEYLPKDSQIHVVGVYEGLAPARSGPPLYGPQPRTQRSVQVIVRSSSRPVVLVLASYEPVTWHIQNAGGQIAAVLLSGYHESSVHGAGNATVLRIGSAYAYSPGGEGYAALRQAVARYTGPMEWRSFQGLYAGSSFTVGGR